MSATIDAEKLSEYFNNCMIMKIEGLAYPVQDVYLEDILQFTKFKLPVDIKGKTVKRVYHQHKYKQRAMQAKEMEKDIKYKADIGILSLFLYYCPFVV